jgi:hypothetical protein
MITIRMPHIGTTIGLGKMGFKLSPAQEKAKEAMEKAKAKKAEAPKHTDEFSMFSTPELKQRLSELEKEVKGAYKSDHDMNVQYQEMKEALAKREKKADAPKNMTEMRALIAKEMASGKFVMPKTESKPTPTPKAEAPKSELAG